MTHSCFSGTELAHREEGATLVEYGLLIGLIALVCVAAIAVFGDSVAGLFPPAADGLQR